jgi:hypothetical protein
MRINLGAIRADGYPDVGVIDPSVTFQSCLPTMCGADPGNMANKYLCTSNGYSGVKSCADPLCKPYCPNAQIEPAVTKAALALKIAPVLTPENVVRPIPSITDALNPVAPSVNTCSLWCDLNGAIQANPLLSAGILLGAFLLLKGRR